MHGGKLRHIETLLDGSGEVTIGRIGPIACAATASESGRTYAILVRKRGETLAALLTRLDEAIERAWDSDEITDEINP